MEGENAEEIRNFETKLYHAISTLISEFEAETGKNVALIEPEFWSDSDPGGPEKWKLVKVYAETSPIGSINRNGA